MYTHTSWMHVQTRKVIFIIVICNEVKTITGQHFFCIKCAKIQNMVLEDTVLY